MNPKLKLVKRPLQKSLPVQITATPQTASAMLPFNTLSSLIGHQNFEAWDTLLHKAVINYIIGGLLRISVELQVSSLGIGQW